MGRRPMARPWPPSATWSTCSMPSSSIAPVSVGGARPRARAHSSHSLGKRALTIRRTRARPASGSSSGPGVEIARRADRQRGLGQQEGGVDPGPGAAAVADREIDLVALQVDHPGGRHQLQVDVRVRLLEGAKMRDQPGGGERGRQGQARDLAAGRAQDRFGCRLDLADRRVDLLEIAPAGRGQAHAGPERSNRAVRRKSSSRRT